MQPGKCPKGMNLPSGHMVFTHASERGLECQQKHMVTMYMVPNAKQYCGCLPDLEPLTWFEMKCCESKTPCAPCGILDAEGKCFYFVVCSDKSDLADVKAAMQAALAAAGASGNAP